MVLIKDILASLSTLEKVELFKRLYEHIAGMGINGDTELAHINKEEGAILKMMGGAGTINEETGLIQYFGGSPPPPPAASSTVTQQQTIPDEMKPYITDVLTQSQALNKQRTEEGYQPYQGAQIAEFQPEQQQAQTGIAGLVGSGQQYFDKASALTEQAGQAPTAEAMQSYMSPYMQNVVDIQKREAMRQGDVAAQGQAYGATQVGAFGGSRDAIVQAEQQRNLATQLGDIQAKGSAAAYADAQQQYAAQQKNALAAGQQFGQMGSAVPGQAMKEFGALESVGAAKQQQEQQALNLAKQQFIQEQTFPEANLQQYSSIIRGYNLPPNTYQSAQAVTPAPSYMQQIAGLGMAGAGIAGAFSGFGKKEGGLVGLAKGGKVLRLQSGGGASVEPGSELSKLSDEELQTEARRPRMAGRDMLINQEIQRRNKLAQERKFEGNYPSGGQIIPNPVAKWKDLFSRMDAPKEQGMDLTSELTSLSDEDLQAAAGGTGSPLRDQLINKEIQKRKVAEYNAKAKVRQGELKAEDNTGPKNPGMPRSSRLEGVPQSQFQKDADSVLMPIAGAASEGVFNGVTGLGKYLFKPAEEAAPNAAPAKQPAPEVPAATPVPPVALPKEAEGIEGPGRKPLLGQKKTEDTETKKSGTNWDDLRAKALTLGDDALVAQDKIREELSGKLDAADEKKKGILGKRKENLDSQKWMALAEMGASVLAQPGGQTFLQSLGKGAKESGILGTLAKLGDKAYDIETDLADMDVKTAVSKYGLSKDQYDALIKNRDSQTKRLETLDTGEYRQNRIIADNTNKENTLLFRTQQLNQATERANSSAENRAGNLAIRQQGLFETQRKNKSKELEEIRPKREVIEKQLLTTDKDSGTYVALLDYLHGLKNVPTKRSDGGLIKPKGTAGEAI